MEIRCIIELFSSTFTYRLRQKSSASTANLSKKRFKNDQKMGVKLRFFSNRRQTPYLLECERPAIAPLDILDLYQCELARPVLGGTPLVATLFSLFSRGVPRDFLEPLFWSSACVKCFARGSLLSCRRTPANLCIYFACDSLLSQPVKRMSSFSMGCAPF